MMPILLLLSCLVYQPNITTLPAYWYGTYRGTLEIKTPGKLTTEVPLELMIKPLDNAARVTWQITYFEGEKKSVRPYELVALSQMPDYFEFKEKSGIRMQARKVENKLYCLFKVKGSLIHVEYEIRPKEAAIHYQVRTYEEKDPLVTSHEEHPQLSVDSYQLVNVESALLKHVETAKPRASKK